jgi:hypothetical protein
MAFLGVPFDLAQGMLCAFARANPAFDCGLAALCPGGEVGFGFFTTEALRTPG